MPLPTIIALVILPLAAVSERLGLLRPQLKNLASRLLIQLCYPALILAALPRSIAPNEWRTLWLLPLATALLLLLGRWVGHRLLPFSGLSDPGQRRSFVFAAILPNYSYVPLLIAQALWGERAMALVVLASVGADLVLWTVALAELSETGRFAWRRLLNPPLISLLLALLITLIGPPALSLLEPLVPWLKAIGSATIPLSMVILGVQLGRPRAKARDARAQILLLIWRLLAAPALIYLLLLAVKLPQLPALVLLTIASMPGAIVTVVLATHYRASPELAARHVFFGHLLAIASSSFWIYLGSRTL